MIKLPLVRVLLLGTLVTVLIFGPACVHQQPSAPDDTASGLLQQLTLEQLMAQDNGIPVSPVIGITSQSNIEPAAIYGLETVSAGNSIRWETAREKMLMTRATRNRGAIVPGANKTIMLVNKVLTMPGGLAKQEASPPQASASSSVWQTIMTEDFETVFPGTKWDLDSNPTWGNTNYKAYAGFYSGWCTRGGTLGRDPQDNNYANNMDAWMVYGPFSLSDANAAELNFWWWNQSEPDHDEFFWGASIDGDSFEGIAVGGSSGEWSSVSFDLADVDELGNLCGQSQVWIAFNFKSNESTTDKGAFVDSIELRKFVAVETTVDLIIDDITTMPEPPVGGESAQIWFRVKNIGDQPIIPVFYCEMFVDGVSTQTFAINGLGNGQSKQYHLTTTLNAGNHNIKVVADSTGAITEGNEDNNELTETILWTIPGGGVVWSFFWGPDVFPKYLPEDSTEVILADLTDIPDGIYGVYWADPVSRTWRAFMPGFPNWSDLESLVPGEDYSIAVGGAVDWHIPLQ